MKFDIRNSKVVFMCPDHNSFQNGRRKHMEQLMREIGIVDWEFYRSGNESYPLCLSKANLNILEKYKYLKKPLLILEDDVEWNGQYQFDIPDDVDGLWLGFSKQAGSPFINECLPEGSWASFSNVPNQPSVFRVINTLTTHAIVYISERFRRFAIEEYRKLSSYTKKLNGAMHHTDVHFSRYQRFFNLYAPMKPYFQQSKLYQKDYLDHVEISTNFEIDRMYIQNDSFAMYDSF